MTDMSADDLKQLTAGLLRSRDLIEWQQRRIEALAAALKQARVVIAVDRESFIQCSTAPHQPLDQDDQGIVDEYEELLRMIDEAMGGNYEPR